MATSDADMARQLQEQFDREDAQLQLQHQQQPQQQPQPQPQPQQQHTRGALTLAVTVPAGTRPGQMILVQAPSGEHVQVELPPYAVPGRTIQVSIPAQVSQLQLSRPEPDTEGGLEVPTPPVPTPAAEDDELARAIQASLRDAAGVSSTPSLETERDRERQRERQRAPQPEDPFAVSGDSATQVLMQQPEEVLMQQPPPPTAARESAAPGIVGTSGAPLNNGAIDLQLYCVDTTRYVLPNLR